MPIAEIDFTGTEGPGRLKDGTYHACLESVEQKEGREYPLWVWTFTSLEPETAGRQAQHTTSLSPKAAYFIRQVLEGLGVEVPLSMAKINTAHYVGREAMIYVIQDGTYTGKNDGEEHPNYKIERVFLVLGGQAPESLSAQQRRQQHPPTGNTGDINFINDDPRGNVKFDGNDIPF
jgi:hypothetical protein